MDLGNTSYAEFSQSPESLALRDLRGQNSVVGQRRSRRNSIYQSEEPQPSATVTGRRKRRSKGNNNLEGNGDQSNKKSGSQIYPASIDQGSDAIALSDGKPPFSTDYNGSLRGLVNSIGNLVLFRRHGTDRLRFRRWLQRIMVSTWVGFFVDFTNIILSGVSCILYVWETYDDERKQLFETIDTAFCAFFGLDYILRVFLADDRLKYIRSPMASIDLLTLVPVIFAFVNIGAEFMLAYQLIRVLRVLRIVRINRFILQNTTSEVSQQITLLVTTVITAGFFCAGLVHIFENNYRESHLLATLQFHEALYFVVVTISTVGYGDINPESDLSKLAVTILICAALVYIPKSTNHLVTLMSSRSIYARNRFNPAPGTDFVVVCGSLDVMAARAFLTELFHEDHGSVDLQAVLLCEQLPSTAMENMLRTQYSINVTYLQGSPLDPNDLLRASVLRCKTCFLLCNKFTNDADTEDAATILRALSIKRFVLQYTGKDIRTCVQLLRLENKQHFTLSHEIMMKDHVSNDLSDDGGTGTGFQFGGAMASKIGQRMHHNTSLTKFSSHGSEARSEDDLDNANTLKTRIQPSFREDPLVCVNEIKMNLLAQACLCPGVITMIGNLVMSVDAPENSDQGQEWLEEYNEGSEFEIYRTKLSHIFRNVPFSKASQLVHSATGALMFALELNCAGLSRVIMNPGHFLIPDIDEYDVHCFVIAQDLESADLGDLDVAYRSFTHTQISSAKKGARSLSRLYTVQRSDDPRQELAHQIVTAKVRRHSMHESSGGKTTGSDVAASSNALPTPEEIRRASLSALNSTNGAKARGWGILKNTLAKTKADQAPSNEHQIDNSQDPDAESYFTLDSPMPLEQITVQTSLNRDFPNVSGHVIICGNLSGLFILIRTLRARHLAKMLPVVILHQEPLPFHVWNQISQFPLIYFVQGSATERRDLSRAGAQFASRAIVLAKSRDAQNVAGDETMSDAHAIFAHQGIIGLNKNIQIVTELINESNVGFLDVGGDKSSGDCLKPQQQHSFSERHVNKTVANASYYTAVQFIAGIVYSPSMLDTLICQSFYNPHITTVFQQLIAGKSGDEPIQNQEGFQGKTEDLVQIAMQKQFVQEVAQSHLFQIPVPREMQDSTYGDLFESLSQDYGMVPLGLLRGVHSRLSDHYKGNHIPYVFTNPPRKTRLSRADKVFVLSKDAPSSKLAGVPLADLFDNVSQLAKGVNSANIIPKNDVSAKLSTSEIDAHTVEKLSADIKELHEAMTEIKRALGLPQGIARPSIQEEEIPHITM